MSSLIKVTSHIQLQQISSSSLKSNSDFSGANISGSAESIESIESLYNGCLFKDTYFKDGNFRSSEFTEAKFEKCTFERIIFDRSDFVLMEIIECNFIDCSFNNGEWRDSKIDGSYFENCSFNSTTVSLCTFESVDLDTFSSNSLIGKSKIHNIFSNSIWVPTKDTDLDYVKFIVSNYGLKGCLERFEIEGLTSLQRLSVLRSNDTEYSRCFIESFSEILFYLSEDSMRNNLVKAKYLTKICESWSEGTSIAVRQIMINQLEHGAKKLKDSTILFEILGLIFKVRALQLEALDSIENEVKKISQDLSERNILKIKLNTEFNDMEHHKIFDIVNILDSSAMKGVSLKRVYPGSVIIELVIVGITSATAVLTALGLCLKGVKFIIHEATDIVKASKAFKNEVKPSKPKEPEKDEDYSVNMPALARVFHASSKDQRTEKLSSVISSCGENILDMNYTSTVEVRARE